MRDPKRIDRMLKLVEAAWKAAPDLRLGQLIENHVPATRVTYYIEDDELERELRAATHPSKEETVVEP